VPEQRRVRAEEHGRRAADDPAGEVLAEQVDVKHCEQREHEHRRAGALQRVPVAHRGPEQRAVPDFEGAQVVYELADLRVAALDAADDQRQRAD
jgi:hypothetical protein